MNPIVPLSRVDVDQSICSRFARITSSCPDRPAVIGEDVELTYRDLDRLANTLAHRIVERLGSSPEAVALLCNQGTAFVVAVLAVLKAGKFFVPLDSRRPDAMGPALVGCHCRLTLHDAANAAAAPPSSMAIMAPPSGAHAACEPPPVTIDAMMPCCVYFTTGSTGTPKGVLDIHRNVLHNAYRYTVSLDVRADDRLSMIQSPSFSGCLSSLFTALLNGAVLCPFDLGGNGLARLPAWIRTMSITVFHSVPSIFQALAQPGAAYPSVRRVRLEGDRATRASIDAWLAHFPEQSNVVIGLGATECGLARRFVVDRANVAGVGQPPLGYACPDVDVRIEDDLGASLPRGETGEIVVESEFLARGYWGRDDLTRAAFGEADPDSGRRRYRTGDLGYLDANDCLHYVARKGAELRVNGKTVDPAPLERAALDAGPAANCIAAQHVDERGAARLVLYYVPIDGDPVSPLAFNRALARTLPSDLLPGYVVPIKALPLSPDGKVARRRLPAPTPAHRVRSEPDVAPRSGLEQAIADAWRCVLGFELNDAHQNVFELGVDSLACEQFLVELERTANVRPGIDRLFDRPTIAGLARDIGRMDRNIPGDAGEGTTRRAAAMRAMQARRTRRGA